MKKTVDHELDGYMWSLNKYILSTNNSLYGNIEIQLIEFLKNLTQWKTLIDLYFRKCVTQNAPCFLFAWQFYQ